MRLAVGHVRAEGIERLSHLRRRSAVCVLRQGGQRSVTLTSISNKCDEDGDENESASARAVGHNALQK